MAAHGAVNLASSRYVRTATVAPAASKSVSKSVFPYSIKYVPLLDGTAGTIQSLEAMAQAVRGEMGPDYSGYLDPYNKKAADQICEAFRCVSSPRSDLAALWDFCAHKLKYVLHPPNQQVVQDARRTLEIGSGDCVSLSVCLATLLACRGHYSRFIAQVLDGEEASHVYTEVLLPNGEALALDPVAADKPMGWRQPLGDGGFEIQWEIF